MVTIDLAGRKALVTGGARGIGAGIVRILAACGADVAFTYLGSERGVRAAQTLVSDLSGDGHAVSAFTAPAQDMTAMGREFSSLRAKARRSPVCVTDVLLVASVRSLITMRSIDVSWVQLQLVPVMSSVAADGCDMGPLCEAAVIGRCRPARESAS